MKKKPSITVGIPAFNEILNISNLIINIFDQDQSTFLLEKVIVANDGSTDATYQVIKKIKSSKLQVINGIQNRGVNFRQNQLIKECKSDILILLNADVLFENKHVLSNLIEPITKGAHLSAQWSKPIWGRTFLEKILCGGFNIKSKIYDKFKNGNNIYTCIGHIRALKREFYRTVKFPLQSEGEDQFLYLSCISNNFTYRRAKKVKTSFRLPNSWNEYKHYARRIFHTQSMHADAFGEQILKRERKIPPSIIIRGVLDGVLITPLYGSLYLFLHMFMIFWTKHKPRNVNNSYSISESTKKL